MSGEAIHPPGDGAGLPETPADSPLTMEEAVALNRGLSTAKVAVGEPAFRFELPLLDADGAGLSGETVRLADLGRGRPIALFGFLPEELEAAIERELARVHRRIDR